MAKDVILLGEVAALWRDDDRNPLRGYALHHPRHRDALANTWRCR
jgi:hypothetical protein